MSEVIRPAIWELPQIDGPVVARSRRAADLNDIEREAWDKGMAEGREAGLKAAQEQQKATQAEFDRRLQQLATLLDFMAKPLAELDDQVQRQLATLAGAIAKQVVRRELKTHPDEVVAVIRETVSLLPMAAREIRVHLNPEDAKLLRLRLTEVTSERAWSIAEDPILTRGGCRVTSENSSIDATVEQRLGAAIASVLGDERGGSASAPAP